MKRERGDEYGGGKFSGCFDVFTFNHPKASTESNDEYFEGVVS